RTVPRAARRARSAGRTQCRAGRRSARRRSCGSGPRERDTQRSRVQERLDHGGDCEDGEAERDCADGGAPARRRRVDEAVGVPVRMWMDVLVQSKLLPDNDDMNCRGRRKPETPLPYRSSHAGESWTIRPMSMLRGGCWCGAVRYEVPDEFLYAWN